MGKYIVLSLYCNLISIVSSLLPLWKLHSASLNYKDTFFIHLCVKLMAFLWFRICLSLQHDCEEVQKYCVLMNDSTFGCCCSVRLVGTIWRFKIPACMDLMDKLRAALPKRQENKCQTCSWIYFIGNMMCEPFKRPPLPRQSHPPPEPLQRRPHHNRSDQHSEHRHHLFFVLQRLLLIWTISCPINKSRRSRVIDEWASCESGRMSQWLMWEWCPASLLYASCTFWKRAWCCKLICTFPNVCVCECFVSDPGSN